MKAGGKVLWKSPCQRWCAVALACVMILTMAAPLPVLAYSVEAEPNGPAAEEPGPAEEPEPPVGSETPGDSQPPEDSEPGEDSNPPADSEPGEDSNPPADSEPGEDSNPPADSEPGEDNEPPADSEPGEDSTPPADSEPGEDNEPPAETPPEDTVPPEEGTTPPADAETDPAAPPAQQPGASLGCPHGDPENCGLCVTAWTWQEDKDLEGALVWSNELGQWTLGLPGLGEDQPLTPDLLLPLLPKTVEVVTAAGKTVVDLVWDLDANLDGANSLEGAVVTANLVGDYVLAADTPKLAVLVAAGGGEGNATTFKYVNQWSFVLSEGTVLKEDKIVLAVADITDVNFVKEMIGASLPPKLRVWAFPGWEVEAAGFTKVDAENDPAIKEKTVGWNSTLGDFVEYGSPTGGTFWGRIDIEWDLTKLPGSFDFDTEYFLSAKVTEKDTTYGIIVNDKKPGGDSTAKNPDLLRISIVLKDMELDKHIIDRVAEPGNVTVNLFDYWVVPAYGENPKPPQGDILPENDEHLRGDPNDPTKPGTNRHKLSWDKDWYTGINEDHLLIFGDGIIHAGLWNKGAGEMTPYGQKYAGMEGIVRPVLVDGYPVINTALARKQLTGVTDTNDPNYRDYTKIGDFRLAGDHVDAGYSGENIQNLSETLIGAWEGTTGQTFSEDTLESLDYLFDPDTSHPNKKSYTDVKGLFQLDEKGNFYYNMRDNFAEFREGGQTDPEQPGYDPNRFILYDNGATTRTDGEKSIGNFFPFNKGSEVFNTLDGDKLGSTVYCARNTMNHHLGMTVEVDFRQPAKGMINTGIGGGDPMTFGFSGDDDVWIFIDDVLVLDLGGTHSEIYGTIDFSTGEIFVGRAFDSHGIPENPKDPVNLVTQTTLKAQYEKANRGDATQWAGETFASNTSHTLKMFYLERGNYDSSIALNFNLQPLLHQRLVKVDQNGRPLKGVEFQLLEAEETTAGTAGAIQCLYTDRGDRGKTFFVKKKNDAPLVDLVTQDDGSAAFMKDGQYFNFADRGDQYYILKEKKAPDGYRDLPVDIVLHYDPATSMLSVANRWTTGAYACSVSNITAATSLTYSKVEDGEVKPGTELVPEEEQEEGIVVAVPLMLKKSDQSWMALYGSNLGGFQPVHIPSGGDEEAWKKAILQAAVQQAGTGTDSVAGWHLDWDSGNRRLIGTLFDLPGLANRYLLNDPINGDLQMIYGILSKDKLAALGITGADATQRYTSLYEYIQREGVEKTLGDLLDGFRFLSVKQFNRDFRSLIYIPNERRELRVLKIDQDGQPLAGTEFGLFSGNETTPRASGVTDANGMLVFSPSGVNGVPGQANAVWAKASDGAEYYLRETKAPAGYDLNPTRIPVVVGYYSIYADAGNPKNGVSVMAGVGTLTQTMRQHATSGEVDVTLQDISAVMQIQNSNQFDLAGWRDAKLSGTTIPRSMNLHFKKNTAEGEDYGLHDEDGGKVYTPYFVTNTGYIRTRIMQNWAALTGGLYEGASPDANMENLYDTDLTNLFSMVNIVVVSDRVDAEITTGSLTVSKELIGPGLTEADYILPFIFTVELQDANGDPLPGNFEYRFYGKDKTGEIASGEQLLLRHDEAVTILGLPVGTKYTITEKPVDGWFVDPPSGVHTGTIIKDTIVSAPFTNSKEPPDVPSSSSSSSSSSGSSESSSDSGGSDPGSDPHDPSDPGSSTRSSGTPPDTGDETETNKWVFASVLFLVGVAALCLARYRKLKDPE